MDINNLLLMKRGIIPPDELQYNNSLISFNPQNTEKKFDVMCDLKDIEKSCPLPQKVRDFFQTKVDEINDEFEL